MIATSAGRDAIVSMLIGHGADINSSNEGGQTALHYAASRNRYEVGESYMWCNLFKCLVKDLWEMAFSFSDLVINIGPVC